MEGGSSAGEVWTNWNDDEAGQGGTQTWTNRAAKKQRQTNWKMDKLGQANWDADETDLCQLNAGCVGKASCQRLLSRDSHVNQDQGSEERGHEKNNEKHSAKLCGSRRPSKIHRPRGGLLLLGHVHDIV